METEMAMFEAVENNDVKHADKLLDSWNKACHDINKLNKANETCLIRACVLGHSEIVALLLEEESLNINYQMPDTLWTAYFFAHSCGHRRIVRLLEEYGADVDLKDKDGKTAKNISGLQGEMETENPKVTPSYSLMEMAVSSVSNILTSTIETTQNKLIKNLFEACKSGTVEEVNNLIESLTSIEVLNITDGAPKNWTLLMWACSEGNYDVVKFLIEKGADIHTKSTLNDWTALHIAASRNYLRITNFLLKHGARPNDIIDPADTHFSGLMYISSLGFVDVARAYLKHGADVNIPANNGATPLHEAVASKDEKMVLLYLDHKANCNVQAQQGWTPLMESARTNCADICQTLLNYGADLKLTMKDAGSITGETALHVSCYYGAAEVTKVLLDSYTNGLADGSAEVNRENKAGLTPLMIATKRQHINVIKVLVEFESLDVNHRNEEPGVSAIDFACQTGNVEICEILSKHGADPQIKGFGMADILSWSRRKLPVEVLPNRRKKNYLERIYLTLKRGNDYKFAVAAADGKYEVVKHFLENKHHDPNIRKPDAQHWSALMWACRNNHIKIVELLLEHGADINAKTDNLFTSLMIASREGHYEILKILLENKFKPDISAANEQGWCALMWASFKRPSRKYTPEKLKENHLKIAKELVHAGADVNQEAKNGWTPLMQASQDGYIELVKFLCTQKNLNINHQCKSSWSALTIACFYEEEAIAKTLVDSGADVTMKKKGGVTALHIACFKGLIGIVKHMVPPLINGRQNQTNINVIDDWGMTPLILAMKAGHKEVVKYLVQEAGAEVNIQAEKYLKWSAIFFALQNEDLDSYHLLVNNRAKTELTDECGYALQSIGMGFKDFIKERKKEQEKESIKKSSSLPPPPSPLNILKYYAKEREWMNKQRPHLMSPS